jgi:uncharacterized iron-regulated membrane protein
MTIRSWLLGIHRYVGLVAAIPLLLSGVSGALVEFELEIDRALNPAYWNVRPQTNLLSCEAIADAVRKAYPKEVVSSLTLPSGPGIAVAVNLKNGLSVTVDPYTGQVLGARASSHTFVAHLHQFHKNLLLGPWGSHINGISALLAVLTSFTGLFLWWKRKAFSIKWSAPWRRVNYDAHHAVGIVALIPWVLLGLTGSAIAFEEYARPALYRLTGSTVPAQPTVKSNFVKGTKPITIDAALDAASRALPGAQIVVALIPSSPTGTFTFFMKFPEDRTPAGRSRVVVDRYSGQIVWLENSRTAVAGTRLWNKNRMIHTGDIFGWPTRILAAAASLLLALQGISGAWMWWGRKRKTVRVTSEVVSGIGSGLRLG